MFNMYVTLLNLGKNFSDISFRATLNVIHFQRKGFYDLESYFTTNNLMISKGRVHNAVRADIDGQKVDAVSSIGLVRFRVHNQG